MIEMPMADEDGVGPFDICRLEAKGRIHAPAIVIRVQQENVSIVDQLEIRVTDPTHRKSMRIAGHRAAG